MINSNINKLNKKNLINNNKKFINYKIKFIHYKHSSILINNLLKNYNKTTNKLINYVYKH